MAKTKDIIKADASLQEKLAIDRTRMANDRTLLSFIRTSLYFAVAGITINSLVNVRYGDLAQAIFLGLSPLILVAGLVKYYQQKRKLKATRNRYLDGLAKWDEEYDED